MARQQGWRILLRVEDLDTPRVKPGVVESMLRTLERLGLDWDHGPVIQSHHMEIYRDAMRTLAARGLVYESAHTRTELDDAAASEAASAPNEGAAESYFPASLRPSVCGPVSFDQRAAATNWRLVVPEEEITVDDVFAGTRTFRPDRTVGDFVVWTKRDQPAYQLAVVVDDARQGVTRVVRGNDLLESAARQRLIYRALGLGPIPVYCHLPLVRGADGRRLAKRHGDTRVEAYLARGVTPQRLIALMARWSGIVPGTGGGPEAMTAAEFCGAFRLDTVPRNDITFTPEDDRWLLESV